MSQTNSETLLIHDERASPFVRIGSATGSVSSASAPAVEFMTGADMGRTIAAFTQPDMMRPAPAGASRSANPPALIQLRTPPDVTRAMAEERARRDDPLTWQSQVGSSPTNTQSLSNRDVSTGASPTRVQFRKAKHPMPAQGARRLRARWASEWEAQMPPHCFSSGERTDEALAGKHLMNVEGRGCFSRRSRSPTKQVKFRMGSERSSLTRNRCGGVW